MDPFSPNRPYHVICYYFITPILYFFFSCHVCRLACPVPFYERTVRISYLFLLELIFLLIEQTGRNT